VFSRPEGGVNETTQEEGVPEDVTLT